MPVILDKAATIVVSCELPLGVKAPPPLNFINTLDIFVVSHACGIVEVPVTPPVALVG